MEALSSIDLPTLENGLSRYHVKLVAYSKQAHLERRHNIARLFESLSFSKLVQALLVLRCMGGVKNTKSNIEECLNESGTGYLQDSEIPPDHIGIIKMFGVIEDKNRHLYTCAVDSLDAGQDINIGTINVCSKCGYVLLGDTTKECNVCHAPSGYFRPY